VKCVGDRVEVEPAGEVVRLLPLTPSLSPPEAGPLFRVGLLKPPPFPSEALCFH
jgi:hypothetical protein